jgi:hypothetical protein
VGYGDGDREVHGEHRVSSDQRPPNTVDFCNRRRRGTAYSRLPDLGSRRVRQALGRLRPTRSGALVAEATRVITSERRRAAGGRPAMPRWGPAPAAAGAVERRRRASWTSDRSPPPCCRGPPRVGPLCRQSSTSAMHRAGRWRAARRARADRRLAPRRTRLRGDDVRRCAAQIGGAAGRARC